MGLDSGPLVDRRTALKFGGTAAFATLGLGALAGCGSSSSSGSSGGTIKMLYFGEQSDATALQKRLAPAIKQLDSKVTLDVQGINGTDWNVFFAKVLTEIAAGTPPDIVSVATEGVQLMASKNLAMPLDSYVKRDMSELKSYFADVDPVLVEAMMYQGHLYELPSDFNAGNMFYSTELFEKAGLSAPAPNWTLSDFEDTAKKIAKVSSGVNAFDWVVRLWGSWTSFMYANNANLLQEGHYSGGDWLWSTAYAGNPAAAGRQGGWKWGDPTANSAGTVEALQYVLDLQKQGLSPSPDVGGGQTLQGMFETNRIGMTIGGGFWAGGLHNAGMKPGSFNVQYFPKWQSQRQLFGTNGYAIFQSSQHKDLSWEVVKMLVHPSSFDILNPGNVTTPARKSLMTAQRYASTGPANWQVFYDTLTDFSNTTPIPAPPYYNALATALNQRTTSAFAGGGSAKAALDGLQSDLEAAASSQAS